MENLSVILPVYNGMPYLKDALSSVLNQSYKDFVVYTIDNGSTDGTEEYLLHLNNEKIKYVRLEKINLINALNTGLDLAVTPFIARMDTDDIIHPQKFEKQIKFLDENKDIDLVGTLGQYISSNGTKHFDINLPLQHEDIVKAMLKSRNAIIHPSIIFRREITSVHGGYDELYSYCEDYEFFLRIGDKIKFANLPERLHYMRISKRSIMSEHTKESIEKYYAVSNKYFYKYDKAHPENEQPENFHLNILQKLDVLSLSIYRKGLSYYLNVNGIIGIFYFFIASIVNPLRLIYAIKRRLSLRIKRIN